MEIEILKVNSTMLIKIGVTSEPWRREELTDDTHCHQKLAVFDACSGIMNDFLIAVSKVCLW